MADEEEVVDVNNVQCCLRNLVKSGSIDATNTSLINLSKYSKAKEHVDIITNENGIEVLFNVIAKKNFSDQESVSAALSIVANCALQNALFRFKVLQFKGIVMIVNALKTFNTSSIINRACRALANLAATEECLDNIRNQDAFFIILKWLGCDEPDDTCRESLLRALRLIINTNLIWKCLYNEISLSPLFTSLRSNNKCVSLSGLKVVTEAITYCAPGDLCRLLQNHEDLELICSLYNESNQLGKRLILQCLFTVASSAQMRVIVGRSGGITVFCKAVNANESITAMRHAIHGLCLCAREAFNRIKIKNSGALKAIVQVLRSDDHLEFHQDLVTAMVWFLFDDMSMAIMLRAGIVNGLMTYFKKLAIFEIERSSLKEGSSTDGETSNASKQQRPSDTICDNDSNRSKHTPNRRISRASISVERSNTLSPYTVPSRSGVAYSPTCSSPETSPYDPRSPIFNMSRYSPEKSPDAVDSSSPPYYYHQAPTPNDMEAFDSLSLGPNSPESPHSSFGWSPPRMVNTYHCQSADGTHAMIHGARGPVHDVFLLLSRLSQTSDPSTYLVNVECFKLFMTYILLSLKPNPKCARLLNRLTLNPNCFESIITHRIVARMQLRLIRGVSLGIIAELLDSARQDSTEQDELLYVASSSTIQHSKRKFEGKTPETSQNKKRKLSTAANDTLIDQHGIDLYEQMHNCEGPTKESKRTGELLLSNLRAHTESSYGKGVLVHMMLTGSNEIKESCVLSLPFLCRSKSLQRRLFIELKALSILIEILKSTESNSDCVVMATEAIHCLALTLGVTFKRNNSVIDIPTEIPVVADNLKNPSEFKTMEIKPVSDSFTLSSTTCDLQFKLSSGTIVYAHRNILRLASPVFSAMLSGQFNDATQAVIPLLDVDDTPFQALIHFIYGCRIDLKKCYCNELCQFEGNVKLSTHQQIHHKHAWGNSLIKFDEQQYFDNILLVLKLSDRFFIDKLKEQCELLTVNEIKPDNAVEVYYVGTLHHSNVLIEASLSFLLVESMSVVERVKHFVELINSIVAEDFTKHLYRKFLSMLQ